MNLFLRIKFSLRNRLRKCLLHLFPELRDVAMNGCWYVVQNYINNSTISAKARLYSKYEVSESEIGDYTYVARNSRIQKTTIGKFCSIGPNLLCGWGIHPVNALSTSPMFYSTMRQNGVTLSDTDKIEEVKSIKIGNDVFIGANVTILDGVTIGDGAIIGAGAVVSKDIPSYAVAVGCPIRIIHYRFSEDKIKKLRRIAWWNFDDERLEDVERMFFNVDDFIEKYG